MTLLRSLLLASALALPTTATLVAVTDIPAEAASRKSEMTKRTMHAKHRKHARRTQHAAMKHCGTFMFRKGAKCMDARAK